MAETSSQQPDIASVDDDRVRDHLANERTYLAWIRTGVAMIGLGVVIAKLRYLLGSNYPASSGVFHAASIGLVFALIGLLTIVMSVFFFLQTRKEIRARNYTSRIHFVVALALVMVVLGLIIVWYLAQPTTLL